MFGLDDFRVGQWLENGIFFKEITVVKKVLVGSFAVMCMATTQPIIAAPAGLSSTSAHIESAQVLRIDAHLAAHSRNSQLDLMMVDGIAKMRAGDTSDLDDDDLLAAAAEAIAAVEGRLSLRG